MRRIVPHRAIRAMAVLIAFSLALVLTTAPASADDPHEDPHPDEHHEDVPEGWLPYDGGLLLEPGAVPGATPLELAIGYFAEGSPAVKWRTDRDPLVAVCTVQANRPSWLTAIEFRESVVLGVEVWSEAEAAVGLDYTGDCPSSSWGQNNGANEIGWDDDRNVVREPAAGVTFGRWADRFVTRDFQETDVILDHTMEVSRRCLDSVVAHELGHVLGFGHSDRRGDLMFPSFDPEDEGTCPGRPSRAEVALLQGLYGTNLAPTIATTGLEQTVDAGARASISIAASDPDGDPITYTWTQSGGSSVGISVSGPSIAFDAPAEAGATLRFRATASDHFGHQASAEVVVRVADVQAAPTAAPYLEGLRTSADRARLALKFTEVSGATQYRFCATPTVFAVPSCQSVTTPLGEITWDTVLSTVIPGESLRVLTGGVRDVKVQACNSEGCVQDDQTQILAGGLRWNGHRVDYDYFAMTQDLGPGDNKFTIALVQNMTGAARTFQLYAGTEDTPLDTLMIECRNLIPGDVCVGFLAPGDAGHGTHVTIRSEREGTPAIENRIRVR